MAEQSTNAFLRHVERTYGLSANGYRALYFAQGGRCYVCRKAAGKARRLGVDHDHVTGEVRGLVCTGSLNAMTCNRLIAIYGRDALIRGAAMLSDPPPARYVLQPLLAGLTTLPFLAPPAKDPTRTSFELSEVRGAMV